MSPAAAADDERRHLARRLDAAAQALGLPLSAQQHNQLLDFVDLLNRWNQSYNLTAIRDKEGMLTHHVVDCLAAVSPFRRELGNRPNDKAVLDVGSGGGLPGVIFAVMAPSIAITCVDSVGKKAAFIQQVGASLQLDNLSSLHSRVEALKGRKFGLVTSRAFSSLADLVQLTEGLIDDAGLWMAMKGKTPDDEIRLLPERVEVFHVEPLRVPGVEGDRCLVWMRENRGENRNGT